MNTLLTKLQTLQKTSVADLIDQRIHEFKIKGNQPSEELFIELCFCILTANCSAESCLKTQEYIGKDFLFLNKKDLTTSLRACGYRFPNIRADYIVKARTYAPILKEKILSLNKQRRAWLIHHIKGINYKEASHFLRNIGYENYGIIDKHILTLLSNHHIIEKPKTMNKKQYLRIEKRLKEIAQTTNLTLASLDLYLWYMQTGKILK
ncbi:MAG: N-glycosylase/DNA lyase [Thermoplasmatota archaeon]